MAREQYSDPSAQSIEDIKQVVDDLELAIDELAVVVDAIPSDIDGIFDKTKYYPIDEFINVFSWSGTHPTFETLVEITGEGYFNGAMVWHDNNSENEYLKITIDGTEIYNSRNTYYDVVMGIYDESIVVGDALPKVLIGDPQSSNGAVKTYEIQRNATPSINFKKFDSHVSGDTDFMVSVLLNQPIKFDTSLKIEVATSSTSVDLCARIIGGVKIV